MTPSHESAPDPISDGITAADGAGWWAPGNGEPGRGWEYETTTLKLYYDDDSINVCQVTPDGERALCAVPIESIALVLAAADGSSLYDKDVGGGS